MSRVIVILLLVGCSVATAPQLSGTYSADCHRYGVRREAGDPDELIDATFTVPMTIENDAIVVGEDCAVPIIGYNGTDFDLQPVDCGGFSVRDGHGTVSSGATSVTMSVVWTGAGWTEEFNTACVLTEAD